MEKDYVLSKSALKDRDVKESTFLVSWSQAGIFIYKGEYREGGKRKNQNPPDEHRLISNSYLAF